MIVDEWLTAEDVDGQHAQGAASDQAGLAVRAAVLPERLNALYARYAVPAVDTSSARYEAEADLLAVLGMAPTAYLACAGACAIACTASGPARIHGVWAGSLLLSHSRTGFSVAPDADAPAAISSVMLAVAFAQNASAGELADPVLLCATALDEHLAEQLAADPCLADVTLEPAGARLYRLQATVTLQVGSGDDAFEDEPDRGMIGRRCTVYLLPSRLLHMARELLALIEWQTGELLSVDDLPWSDRRAPELVLAPWLGRLPDLPAWALQPDALGADALESHARWLELAGVAEDSSAAAALLSWATLAHGTASLAARFPLLGWAALLAASDPEELPRIAAHAAGADITLLPPSILFSDLEWLPAQEADAPSLRCPLSVIRGAEHQARTIAQARWSDGPFSSIFDLLRRVEGLLGDLPAVRRLVACGALDDLHERASLEQRWTDLEEWCAAASAAAARGELASYGDPAFAADLQVRAAQSALIAWSSMLGDDMALSVSSGQDIALVARDRQAGAGHGGAAEPLAGHAVARRMLTIDGQPLSLLAFEAGGQQYPVLVDSARLEALHAAPKERLESLPVLRCEAPGGQLLVGEELVARDVRSCVEITLQLVGDKQRDLERITRVQSIVQAHPGPCGVRLILLLSEARRPLAWGNELGVEWSPSLVDELEVVAGAGCVQLLDAARS